MYRLNQKLTLPSGDAGIVFRVHSGGNCATVYLLDDNGEKIKDGYNCRGETKYRIAVTTKGVTQ